MIRLLPTTLAALATLVFALPPATHAQGMVCVPFELLTKAVDLQHTKCAYEEYQQSAPPLRKMYLKQRIESDHTEQWDISGTNAEVNTYSWSQPGPWGSSYTRAFNAIKIQTAARWTCVETNEYSGSDLETSDGLDERFWHSDNPYDGYGADEWDYHAEEAAKTFEVEPVNGEFKWVGEVLAESSTHFLRKDGNPTNYWDNTSSTNPLIYDVEPFYVTGGDVEITPTSMTITANPPPEGGSATSVYTLQNEYTDSMLRDDIRDHLPAYPAEWSAAAAAAKYIWINGPGGILAENHLRADCGRMKYRFRLPMTERETTYLIEWEELTTYPDGSTEPKYMSEEVKGTGGEALGEEHEIDVPDKPSVITVENVSVSILPDPQGGGGGGGGGSGVAFSVGMGRAGFGGSAGGLALRSMLPSAALSTPATRTAACGRPPTRATATPCTPTTPPTRSPA